MPNGRELLGVGQLTDLQQAFSAVCGNCYWILWLPLKVDSKKNEEICYSLFSLSVLYDKLEKW
jgi:hypothetical protein